MKKNASIILMFVCSCAVFAQEKELPQAEIQKMYIDYLKNKADEIRDFSPTEMEPIYLTIDSVVKKYQPLPNRPNNTLRKFKYLKVFPFRYVFDIKTRTSKLSDSERIAFVDAYVFGITLFTRHFFSVDV